VPYEIVRFGGLYFFFLVILNELTIKYVPNRIW